MSPNIEKMIEKRNIKELIKEALKTKTTNDTKEAAIKALTELKDETIINELIKALNNKKKAIKINAINILAEIKDSNIILPLLKSATDEDKEVSEKAMNALRSFKDEKAIERLIYVLKNSENDIRAKAAIVLGKTGSKKAIEHLIQALNTEDPNLKNNIIFGLSLIEDSRIIEPLSQFLIHEDIHIRSTVAAAIGKLGDPRGIESLLQLLKLESQINLYGIIYKIGELEDSRAINPLFNFYTELNKLKEDSQEFHIGGVKEYIIKALGKIKAVDPLINILNIEDSIFQNKVIKELSSIGGPKAINGLINILNQKVEIYTVHQEAAKALGKIADKTALKSIIQIRNKVRNRNVHFELNRVIKKLEALIKPEIDDKINEIRNIKEIQPLKEALKHPNLQVRLEAVKSLGRIKDPDATDGLIDALYNHDADIRYNAIDELEMRKVPIDKLIKALKHYDSEVRKFAIIALEKGDLNDEYNIIDPVIQALNEEILRYSALGILNKFQKIKEVNSVLPIFKLEDYFARPIIDKIDTIKDLDNIKPLIYIFKTEKDEFKDIALKALGKIRSAKTIEFMLKILENEEEKDFWYKANIILDNITEEIGKSAINTLVQGLKSESKDVREKAESLITKIKDSGDIKPLDFRFEQDIIPVQECLKQFIDEKSHFFILFFSGKFDNYGKNSYINLLKGLSKLIILEKLAFWSGDLLNNSGFDNLLNIKSNKYTNYNSLLEAINKKDKDVLPEVPYLIFVFSKQLINQQEFHSVLIKISLEDKETDYWGMLAFEKGDFKDIISSLARCGISTDTKLELTTEKKYIWRYDKILSDELMEQIINSKN